LTDSDGTDIAEIGDSFKNKNMLGVGSSKKEDKMRIDEKEFEKDLSETVDKLIAEYLVFTEKCSYVSKIDEVVYDHICSSLQKRIGDFRLKCEKHELEDQEDPRVLAIEGAIKKYRGFLESRLYVADDPVFYSFLGEDSFSKEVCFDCGDFHVSIEKKR